VIERSRSSPIVTIAIISRISRDDETQRGTSSRAMVAMIQRMTIASNFF
jgi:hypothetical protein